MPPRPVLNYLSSPPQRVERLVGESSAWIVVGWTVILVGCALLMALLLFPELVLAFASA